MKNRKNKHRLYRLWFQDKPYLRWSDEDRAWESMAPVGREFGSPDYERLMELDNREYEAQIKMKSESRLEFFDTPAANPLAALKGILGKPSKPVSIEDINTAIEKAAGKQ
jgi:hypothetical protein